MLASPGGSGQGHLGHGQVSPRSCRLRAPWLHLSRSYSDCFRSVAPRVLQTGGIVT